jgi:predicted Zn-dependent protease
MWAGMRWGWNDATEDQKKSLRQAWATALTAMVQAPQSPTSPLPPAAQPPAGQEPDTITILSKMSPEQASAEMMKRLQNRSLAASTLSNIMTMKYESSMNIIRNMNSGIRYEYRYR